MRSTLAGAARAGLCALALAAAVRPAAAQPGGPPPDFPVSAQERATIVAGAASKLETSYVLPDVGKQMAADLRARAARHEYDQLATARALDDRLTADLRKISHDGHLHFEYDPNGVPGDGPGDGDFTPAQMEAQRPWLEKVNFGFEKAERMRGNVGYVEIMGFVPPELGGPTASAAMQFLANSDVLIIDLRRNGGGEPSGIAYLLSYLFDQKTHLNDIYDRTTGKTKEWWTRDDVPGKRFGGKKPIYVLTSKQTFSGAEELAYDLKTLGRATIVGETTGGGAHPVRPYKVSDHFAIGVPYARAINPVTKTNWEGKGVTPDIAVPAEQALDTAYRTVLEKMLAGTSDPGMKGQIQQLLDELAQKKG